MWSSVGLKYLMFWHTEQQIFVGWQLKTPHTYLYKYYIYNLYACVRQVTINEHQKLLIIKYMNVYTPPVTTLQNRTLWIVLHILFNYMYYVYLFINYGIFKVHKLSSSVKYIRTFTYLLLFLWWILLYIITISWFTWLTILLQNIIVPDVYQTFSLFII